MENPETAGNRGNQDHYQVLQEEQLGRDCELLALFFWCLQYTMAKLDDIYAWAAFLV